MYRIAVIERGLWIPPSALCGSRCSAVGASAPARCEAAVSWLCNQCVRLCGLPGFDVDLAGRRPRVCVLDEAELCVGIEGTLGPELMFALARRNDVVLPYLRPGVRGRLPRWVVQPGEHSCRANG